MMRLDIGYCPKPLDLTVGDVAIQTLDGLEAKVTAVTESGLVAHGWCFAPNATRQVSWQGEVKTTSMPHSSRVFALPKTHSLVLQNPNNNEHAEFLVWALGFILGMRLTSTEAGFLDATPIEPGMLHDQVWNQHSQLRAIEIADAYWRRSHAHNPRIAKGLAGIIHSLFLSQTPTLLDFERFVYLYIAMDGCYAVASTSGKCEQKLPHGRRIACLCEVLKCACPSWADPDTGGLAGIRNDTLHEGLYCGEPLGFNMHSDIPSPHDPKPYRNTLLEIQNLVCRFVCGLIGFNDFDYISSRVDTRQRYAIRLETDTMPNRK